MIVNLSLFQDKNSFSKTFWRLNVCLLLVKGTNCSVSEWAGESGERRVQIIHQQNHPYPHHPPPPPALPLAILNLLGCNVCYQLWILLLNICSTSKNCKTHLQIFHIKSKTKKINQFCFTFMRLINLSGRTGLTPQNGTEKSIEKQSPSCPLQMTLLQQKILSRISGLWFHDWVLSLKLPAYGENPLH